jgi:hypothetical protein
MSLFSWYTWNLCGSLVSRHFFLVKFTIEKKNYLLLIEILLQKREREKKKLEKLERKQIFQNAPDLWILR